MRIVIDFCTIIILQRSAHTSLASGASRATQLHNYLQTKSGDESSGDFMFDKIQNLLLLGSGLWCAAMATVSQVTARDAYQEFFSQVRIVIVINSPICPMFVHV